MTNNENGVESPPSLILTGKVYDFVKTLVLMIIPAISTLYFALAAIWGFPNAEKVSGTLAALAAFLGVIVGLSKRAFDKSDLKFDGDVVIDVNESGALRYTLELNGDPADIVDKKEVSFKVLPPPMIPK